MRKYARTPVLAAVMVLAACSGDGTGPGPDGGDGTLTAAQARQLNQAILGVSYGVRDQQSRASHAIEPGDGAARSRGTLNFGFDETARCAPGGTIDVAGSVGLAWDDEARTGGLSADFSVDHDRCAHRLDNGEIIVISGDPDIDVTLDLATGPAGVESLVIRETGAFTWSRGDGVGGSCTLDVTAALNPASGEVLVSGSFCGVDVSGTFDGD